MGEIFFNPDIFESDADYVIGGFETNKLKDFTYAEFYSNMVNRVTNLVDKYVEEAIPVNIELGYLDPEEKARQSVADIISDYLDVSPQTNDTYTLVQTIVNHEKMQTWLTNLKIRIKDAQDSLTNNVNMDEGSSIRNKISSAVSSEYRNAVYFTQEANFAELIEEIASIEM